MRLLLDTATVLWIAIDSPELSAPARVAFNDRQNELFISVVSIWELLVKHHKGKLPLPVSVEALIRPLTKSGAATVLPLTESAVLQLATLPDLHRDPFDRMLICQAIDEDLAIITPDRAIAAYSIEVIW